MQLMWGRIHYKSVLNFLDTSLLSGKNWLRSGFERATRMVIGVGGRKQIGAIAMQNIPLSMRDQVFDRGCHSGKSKICRIILMLEINPNYYINSCFVFSSISPLSPCFHRPFKHVKFTSPTYFHFPLSSHSNHDNFEYELVVKILFS